MQIEQVGADVDAQGQRRRERLVLVILAAVQFITVVDFMIVMPLGPQLMRLARNPTGRVRPHRVLLYFCRGGRGNSGFVDHRPLRPAQDVHDPVRRLSVGHAAVCPGHQLPLAGPCPRYDRGLWGHPGRDVDDDHRGRFSRRAARAGHQFADDRFRAGLGGRRSAGAVFGHELWLAHPLYRTGAGGHSGAGAGADRAAAIRRAYRHSRIPTRCERCWRRFRTPIISTPSR